ncbi:hypothetical protein IBA8401_27800 [Pseudomonas syringae]
MSREQLSLEIIEAGRFLYGRGWSPATSSNYSARLSASEALLTVSGKHKGQLGPDDVLATDLAGNSLEPGKKNVCRDLAAYPAVQLQAAGRRRAAHPLGQRDRVVEADHGRSSGVRGLRTAKGL